MTANQTTEKTPLYWHVALEDSKGRNDVKIHLLLHLLYEEDYAYNIANFFKKSKIKINTLCEQSQIQPILADMENKGFLLSRKSEASPRVRRYFSINPAILQSPMNATLHILSSGRGLYIRKEDLEELFAALKGCKRPDPSQLGIQKFDFIAFLLAVRALADVYGFLPLSRELDLYISEVERIEREVRRIYAKKILPTPDDIEN
ncbi:helix-turn-helix transcriptional regulator [Methanotrichaceae archaeon M04Ac]|uniref:Helix-turn-helix transcriptional regulator n=1 Tax=Candidatus Methanocrinis alkalitolerans TaxID=3033395 RepID=A0ABT5XHS6_9EURY|nr:hypothetical protein [Candidatus Methanocrinis alkalitolerans]MDF0594264.1 helix-turn-helix transcriptional regulator [Candidatus Methanocrinis alkalitolerans]